MLSVDPAELVDVFDATEIVDDTGTLMTAPESSSMPGVRGVGDVDGGDHHDREQVDWPLWLHPRYNIAPSQTVPVILEREPRADGGRADDPRPLSGIDPRDTRRTVRKIAGMRWGLVPSWSKGPGSVPAMINARVETLDIKPSYRHPLAQRRCILPATGYFEWQKFSDRDKPSQPFYFRNVSGELLYFAGLYEFWRAPRGMWLSSCTIITTAARGAIGEIHPRRPVAMEADALDDWLDPRQTDPQQALDLLEPLSAGMIRADAVDRRVNSASAQGPELIRPITSAELEGNGGE